MVILTFTPSPYAALPRRRVAASDPTFSFDPNPVNLQVPKVCALPTSFIHLLHHIPTIVTTRDKCSSHHCRARGVPSLESCSAMTHGWCTCLRSLEDSQRTSTTTTVLQPCIMILPVVSHSHSDHSLSLTTPLPYHSHHSHHYHHSYHSYHSDLFFDPQRTYKANFFL